FFHIPFLIANTLNANQQFSDAQKWYQYIFNPTQPPHLAGYWPLNEGSGETLNDLAGNANGAFFQANWQTVSDFPGVVSRSVLDMNHLGWVSFPPARLQPGSEMTVSFWSFGGNSSDERATVSSKPTGDGSASIIFDIIPPTPNGEIYFACGG